MARLVWVPTEFEKHVPYSELGAHSSFYRIFKQDVNNEDLKAIFDVIEQKKKKKVKPGTKATVEKTSIQDVTKVRMMANLISPPIKALKFKPGGTFQYNSMSVLNNADNVQFFVTPVFAFKDDTPTSPKKQKAIEMDKFANALFDKFGISKERFSNKNIVNNVKRYRLPEDTRGTNPVLGVAFSKDRRTIMLSNKIPADWANEMIQLLAQQRTKALTNTMLGILFVASTSVAEGQNWIKGLIAGRPHSGRNTVNTFPNTYTRVDRKRGPRSLLAGPTAETKNNNKKDNMFVLSSHPLMFIYVNLNPALTSSTTFSEEHAKKIAHWVENNWQKTLLNESRVSRPAKTWAIIKLIVALVPMLLGNMLDYRLEALQADDKSIPFIAILSCPSVLLSAAEHVKIQIEVNTKLALIRHCIRLAMDIRGVKPHQVTGRVSRIPMRVYAEIITFARKPGEDLWVKKPFLADKNARMKDIEEMNARFLADVKGDEIWEEEEEEEEKEEVIEENVPANPLKRGAQPDPLALSRMDPKKRKLVEDFVKAISGGGQESALKVQSTRDVMSMSNEELMDFQEWRNQKRRQEEEDM